MNGCSRMDNEQGDNMNRPHDQSKEWKLIEKVVMEMQGEQKRSRRWGIFFKLLTFTYLIGILMLLRVPGEGVQVKPAGGYAAVVEVNGVIAADQDASADLLIKSEEHTSELQSRENLVCRLPLEKKKIETTATALHS